MARSRDATAFAPMRIGLAGGGSDAADHAVAGGGAVVSAAIDLMCRATLTFEAGADRLAIGDRHARLNANATALRRAAHAYMVETYGLPQGDYQLETVSDAAPGCGLGSSSSLVVAIVSAYARAFDLSIGRQETAYAAWRIERRRLGWPGGLQDQFCAAFGGVHLFRFGPGLHVEIDRCDNADLIDRLQASLCLFTLDEYKTTLSAPGAVGAVTTAALRDDALRLWSDFARGSFGTLPAILTASHRIKRNGIASETMTVLAKLGAIDAVEAVKMCGAGPLGVFLIHYKGDFDALRATAHAQGVAGRFIPIVIAPPADDISAGCNP